MERVFLSQSEAQTEAIGAEIAEGFQGGDVVLLYGELGCGKTALVRGAARVLGVQEVITSPTYTLIQPYEADGGLTVYHADLYRIEEAEELFEIGFEECLFAGGIVFVEWPQIAADMLAGLKVQTIRIEKTEDKERRITLIKNGHEDTGS